MGRVGGVWIVEDFVLRLFRDDERGSSIQVLCNKLNDGFNKWLSKRQSLKKGNEGNEARYLE